MTLTMVKFSINFEQDTHYTWAFCVIGLNAHEKTDSAPLILHFLLGLGNLFATWFFGYPSEQVVGNNSCVCIGDDMGLRLSSYCRFVPQETL